MFTKIIKKKKYLIISGRANTDGEAAACAALARKKIFVSLPPGGVCPSCNIHRMAETAARLGDHVIPRLPVQQ